MARPYFTLVELGNCGKWFIEFGDYDRETVAQEMRDRKDAARYINRGTCPMKIVRTANARQASINAAVDKLNEKTT
jgi:hypothetical protein